MEFSFFAEPPEEIKRMMEEQADRQAAVYEATRLEVERLFNDMTPDQLAVMKRLINSIVVNDIAGPYWEGVITTYMTLKHGVCPGCGKDHDKEMREALSPSSIDSLKSQVGPDREQVGASTSSEVEGQLALPYPQQIGLEDYLQLCETYNMEPVDMAHMSSMSPVKCKGCGLEYISLADRMIKPPGVSGCHGCQSKSAWG